MPNSKVIDGRLHVQDDNGVYKRMPVSYDEANASKNPNVPDFMKNDGNVLLKVITKGERTEDGKSIKCKLPVEIGGERKMIGLNLDADKMDTTREAQKNNAHFNLDAHDRLVASVKDKDGSVDKVEFTVGRIAELNNEAWKSYVIANTVPYSKGTEDSKSTLADKYPETQEFLASKFDPAKAKELAERMSASNNKISEKKHEKVQDTVPYGDSEASRSTLADKYPETQAILNAKWDRYNVDAALGLSEESQSDGAEFE